MTTHTRPLPCTGTNQAECVSEEDSVSVFVKIGAYFHIKVASKLTIERVVFDFSDSLLEWNSLCQTQRRNSCRVSTHEDMIVPESIESGCHCQALLLNAGVCNFHHPVSLFSALHNPNAQRAPRISLHDVSIQHLHSSYNSLFGFESIQLEIRRSLFEDISICGGIVNSLSHLPYSNASYISRVQS